MTKFGKTNVLCIFHGTKFVTTCFFQPNELINGSLIGWKPTKWYNIFIRIEGTSKHRTVRSSNIK